MKKKKNRYSIKEIKQYWKETLQGCREGEDPYIDGKRKKESDILLGFFLMIGGVLVGCGPVVLIFINQLIISLPFTFFKVDIPITF